MFVALIVGLLVEELIPTLGKNKKLRIKMPDAVLPAVVQSFNLLIPIIVLLIAEQFLWILGCSADTN